jgi:phosphoenolpyruvate carboxykinase (ATP)
MSKQTSRINLKRNLDKVLKKHRGLHINPTRSFMIREAVRCKEAIVSSCGALATWTPFESTGRSPDDTYIVKDSITSKTVDWKSKNNIPMKPEVFDMIWEDALKTLSKKEQVFITDRALGADVHYALHVRTIGDQALTALFTDNMFRRVPKNLNKSILNDEPFLLLVLPYDKLDTKKYKGKLRLVDEKDKNSTSWMAVTMDMNRRMGIVYGSAYGGSVKKLMFTVMNYIMPEVGVLPIHCSANEGDNGESALLLGLSGTGKTTLSADPTRALLGDDEHGWSENGIFNFENGCYAKLINLRQDKEPDIWHAVLHDDKTTKHGVIIENAMIYPNGTFDLDDERITPNSRASYPLSYLANIKKSSTAGHPSTILFLTADAFGVLPPIAKLTTEQAMLWFLMGYTSKLAGTETGIKKPRPTFSRFFGQPFMPCNPDVYAGMLGKKLEKHNTQVYLINTGWSGGDYHEGERIDIKLTRRMVHAVLDGEIENVQYKLNKRFHLWVPTKCPGVPSKILDPINTWKSRSGYTKKAKDLAKHFAKAFDKNYKGKGIDKSIESQCPGK